MRRLITQDAVVDRAVTGDAVRPGALGVDEIERLFPDARPRSPVGQRGEDALRQMLGIVRPEKVPRLAVANKLAMPADARSHDDALLRHCFEWLKGRYQLG